MKKIEAIIRPYKLKEVREALEEIDIKGMTIIDVKGLGRQKGHKEIYRGAEYDVDFLPKIKMEIVVDDEQLDDALDIIMTTSRTGQIGDGKIFISTIDQTLRIRTGETGEEAM